jgi:hypothetical protein
MKMPKYLLWGVVSAFCVVIFGLSVSRFFTVSDKTVRLVFNAEVGGQPLVFNKFVYVNPVGGEKFRIRNFKFYLTNVKLNGKEGQFVEPDSYHLARFDSPDMSYSITLNDVDLSELNKISLSIGIDSKANTSLEMRGDLDPNGQMAWNWKVGYKFVLLEGGIRVDDQVKPLVYHVGFSENRRALDFVFPEKLALRNDTTIQFNVDVMKIFSSKSRLNMAKIHTVKFDKTDSKLIADNYRNMISIVR